MNLSVVLNRVYTFLAHCGGGGGGGGGVMSQSLPQVSNCVNSVDGTA